MDQLDLQTALHVLVQAIIGTAKLVTEFPGASASIYSSNQTGTVRRTRGGSVPSSHPLSLGGWVVLSLSASRANGMACYATKMLIFRKIFLTAFIGGLIAAIQSLIRLIGELYFTS